MHDEKTTVDELKKQCDTFVAERDWNQFHSLKSLSMNIAVEAAELMEHFLWCSTQQVPEVLKQNRADIEDELADVVFGICAFANEANIDIATALERKLEKQRKKYPIEKCKGKSDKYTKYT